MGKHTRLIKSIAAIGFVGLAACQAPVSHVEARAREGTGGTLMAQPAAAQDAAVTVTRLTARSVKPASAQPERTSASSTMPAQQIKTIVVDAPYTDPTASQFDGMQCRGLAAPSPDCRVAFVGKSLWSGGTITGDEHYDLTGFATTDGKLWYEGPAYITGTIAGCGMGSFILDNYDGYIDFTKYDPQNNLPGGIGGSAPGFNHWRVRPGSGTGGLTNLVSGEGVNHWRDYVGGDAGLGTEGVGDFTGVIRCAA